MDGRVRRWRPWVCAVAAVAGVGLGLALAPTSPSPADLRAMVAPLVPLEGLLLLQVPALLLAAVGHELGHALVARAVGIRVAGWRIGPLVAARSGPGWRLRLVPGPLRGGLVRIDAVQPGHLRARHAAMTAGGPAAHLALAGIVLAVAVLRGGLPLWLTAVTLTLSGLVSLLPLELGADGRWTDGRWLQAWLLRPELAAQRVGTGTLQTALGSGRRPREWDERWAGLAAAGPRQPADRVQVAGCLLTYAWALDRGDVDAAARLITRAFAARRLLPPGARLVLAAETAFFVARYRCDAALAERLLEGDVRGPLPALEAHLQRARAAVHLAAGRRLEALTACDRALAALDRPARRPAGISWLDRELVLAMREEARRSLQCDPALAPAAITAP